MTKHDSWEERMLTHFGRRVIALVVWLVIAMAIVPSLLSGTPLLVRIVSFGFCYAVVLLGIATLLVEGSDG
jgi:hypothetical protein